MYLKKYFFSSSYVILSIRDEDHLLEETTHD
jgi:hypothetical protein